MYDNSGQANSCCLIFNAIITMTLCLSSGQRIAWLMDAVYKPVCYTCWYGICCYNKYYGGEWWVTRPLTQDKLPPPKKLPDTYNGTNMYDGYGGDDEADYWSVWVLMFCGTFASLLVVCTACGPAMRKGGPPLATAVIMFIAFLLHLACVICVGVQFFSYEEDQVVFNYFKDCPSTTDPAMCGYVTIDTTLSYYLSSNRYYYSFGNCVVAAFTFCIFSCFYEGIFALCAVLAHHDVMDAKATGVRKWDSKAWGEPSVEAGRA